MTDSLLRECQKRVPEGGQCSSWGTNGHVLMSYQIPGISPENTPFAQFTVMSRKLGGGIAGTVFSMKKPNGGIEEVAVKFVSLLNQDKIRSFLVEGLIQVLVHNDNRDIALAVNDIIIYRPQTQERNIGLYGMVMMEKLDSNSLLRDYIRHAERNLQNTAFLEYEMNQVVPALVKLHISGILHGDAHCENIGRRGRDTVLLDWGRATVYPRELIPTESTFLLVKDTAERYIYGKVPASRIKQHLLDLVYIWPLLDVAYHTQRVYFEFYKSRSLSVEGTRYLLHSILTAFLGHYRATNSITSDMERIITMWLTDLSKRANIIAFLRYLPNFWNELTHRTGPRNEGIPQALYTTSNWGFVFVFRWSIVLSLRAEDTIHRDFSVRDAVKTIPRLLRGKREAAKRFIQVSQGSAVPFVSDASSYGSEEMEVEMKRTVRPPPQRILYEDEDEDEDEDDGRMELTTQWGENGPSEILSASP